MTERARNPSSEEDNETSRNGSGSDLTEVSDFSSSSSSSDSSMSSDEESDRNTDPPRKASPSSSREQDEEEDGTEDAEQEQSSSSPSHSPPNSSPPHHQHQSLPTLAETTKNLATISNLGPDPGNSQSTLENSQQNSHFRNPSGQAVSGRDDICLEGGATGNFSQDILELLGGGGEGFVDPVFVDHEDSQNAADLDLFVFENEEGRENQEEGVFFNDPRLGTICSNSNSLVPSKEGSINLNEVEDGELASSPEPAPVSQPAIAGGAAAEATGSRNNSTKPSSSKHKRSSPTPPEQGEQQQQQRSKSKHSRSKESKRSTDALSHRSSSKSGQSRSRRTSPQQAEAKPAGGASHTSADSSAKAGDAGAKSVGNDRQSAGGAGDSKAAGDNSLSAAGGINSLASGSSSSNKSASDSQSVKISSSRNHSSNTQKFSRSSSKPGSSGSHASKSKSHSVDQRSATARTGEAKSGQSEAKAGGQKHGPSLTNGGDEESCSQAGAKSDAQRQKSPTSIVKSSEHVKASSHRTNLKSSQPPKSDPESDLEQLDNSRKRKRLKKRRDLKSSSVQDSDEDYEKREKRKEKSPPSHHHSAEKSKQYQEPKAKEARKELGGETTAQAGHLTGNKGEAGDAAAGQVVPEPEHAAATAKAARSRTKHRVPSHQLPAAAASNHQLPASDAASNHNVSSKSSTNVKSPPKTAVASTPPSSQRGGDDVGGDKKRPPKSGTATDSHSSATAAASGQPSSASTISAQRSKRKEKVEQGLSQPGQQEAIGGAECLASQTTGSPKAGIAGESPMHMSSNEEGSCKETGRMDPPESEDSKDEGVGGKRKKLSLKDYKAKKEAEARSRMSLEGESGSDLQGESGGEASPEPANKKIRLNKDAKDGASASKAAAKSRKSAQPVPASVSRSSAGCIAAATEPISDSTERTAGLTGESNAASAACREPAEPASGGEPQSRTSTPATEDDLINGYDVLDEVIDSDSDTKEGAYESSSCDEDIFNMLEADMPKKKNDGGPEAPHKKENELPEVELISKRVMEERGGDEFDVLPLGWIKAMHTSGIPIYYQKDTKVVTLSRPYYVGNAGLRKHNIPISAVPCLSYRYQTERRSGAKEKEAPSSTGVLSSDQADQTLKKGYEDGGVCPFPGYGRENVSPDSTTIDNTTTAREDTSPQEGVVATSSSGSSAPPSSKAPSSCPVAAGTKESAYKVIQDTKRDLTNEELQEYCSKLFKFKTIQVQKFSTWKERKEYFIKMKKSKIAKMPELPEGTSVLTIPTFEISRVEGTSGETAIHQQVVRKSRKKWVFNPNGKTAVCLLHEYVQHSLRSAPKYEYDELDNAATPYSATITINGMEYGQGVGPSKKIAKSRAARQTLQMMVPELKDLPNPEEEDLLEAPDLKFFNDIRVEDPRVAELCNRANEPGPYYILLTCLQRNYGLGDTNVSQQMKNARNGKMEYIMSVNKREISVICKNKKDGKQLAAQKLLQQLHPNINNWGSLLRMYGNRSTRIHRQKKQKESEVLALQSKSSVPGGVSHSLAILNKLKDEMRNLREIKQSIVPIGKFQPPAGVSATGLQTDVLEL